MSFKLFGVNFKIHFLFTVIVSLLLCIDKSGVAIYSLLSVLIHEAGHIAALLIIGQKPTAVMLCTSGVQIKTNCIYSRWSRFFVAACGPLVNILPIPLITNSYFKTAMLVNGVFNLLPVIGTDGADMLECIFCERTESSCVKFILNIVIITMFIVLGIIMLIQNSNPTLLMSSIYFLILLISSYR